MTGPERTAPVWAGVDLGGTGTRVVVVGADGVELSGTTVASSSFGGAPVDELADLVLALVPDHARLLGVGVGASGPVNLRTGEIRNPDTLPRFSGLDVAGGLARRTGTPAWIDNDAVVAGLAEAAWGAAAGSASVLCVTLGTGIGAAMIQGRLPVLPADGQHPEGGHIAVAGAGSPCYCGLPQCWEQVASRSALDRLRADVGGDEVALWAEYARRLAGGLVTLLTLYHPGCVVIGGGVAQHWSSLEQPLRLALAGFREFDASRPLLAS
ncbi:MAG: ROK family protein, partial [Chloroflexota bacterium]